MSTARSTVLGAIAARTVLCRSCSSALNTKSAPSCFNVAPRLALRVGASGFLVKDTEPVDLLRGVRAVAAGDGLLSPGVTRRLIEQFAARARAPIAAKSLAPLTEREREVMALVGAGLSNEDIAGRLHVSPATAKTHVSRAMIKMGARDRAQLVVYAYEAGLVSPGWLA